jgi:ABC-type sugar transport system substrate-binding protein
LREVTELLIKHYGLHEGLYDLSFEIVMGASRVASEQGRQLPGAFFGIRNVGLVRASELGSGTVDAAVVNPPAAAKRTATRKRPK